MIDPLKSIDRWAAQSVDRAALLIWLVSIVLGAFVVLAIMGEVWYTEPPRVTHLDRQIHTHA